MSLSCMCDDYDCGWYYDWNQDTLNFKPLDTSRRKRCQSCGGLINPGSRCLAFDCYREPASDVEERIKGDFVHLAPRYLCEPCGEIFLNLTDLGYCFRLGENMREAMADYHTMTGFTPGPGAGLEC